MLSSMATAIGKFMIQQQVLAWLKMFSQWAFAKSPELSTETSAMVPSGGTDAIPLSSGGSPYAALATSKQGTTQTNTNHISVSITPAQGGGYGTSVQADGKKGEQMGAAISSLVRQMLLDETRPNGIIQQAVSRG
jgi:hypothetical protein